MTHIKTPAAPAAALLDLALILGTLLGLKAFLLNVYAFWTYAGPISLITAAGVATWRLQRTGQSWSDLGLSAPASRTTLAIWTVVALVVTMAAGILADTVTSSLMAPASEATQAIDARYQGRFSNLPGNLSAYIFWLATAWIVGGFAEEMLFRGVVFTRLEQLMGRTRLATAMAVLGQGLLFGQQHYYYQGLPGLVSTALIGIVSGALFLVFRRSLWPLVISHGLGNTIGLTLIYLGIIG